VRAEKGKSWMPSCHPIFSRLLTGCLR